MATNKATYEHELPVRYKDSQGIEHMTISVSELSGKEEEMMADPLNRNNSAKILTAMLMGCVTQIGNITSITNSLLQDLPIAIRDFAILKIREASYGKELDTSVVCKTCDKKIFLSYNLDDLEIVYVDNNDKDFTVTTELLRGFATEKNGKINKVALILPNGIDQEEISVVLQRNAGKGNTAILTCCINKFIGNMLDGSPSEIIKPIKTDRKKSLDFMQLITDLAKIDRDHIGNVIKTSFPGPKFIAHVICTNCNDDYEAPLNIADFFVLKPR